MRGDYLLTVDSRGYPFFTFEMNSALWLSPWTGTDFGHEPVTAPGEEVDDPGSVTVDERGRLSVAYRAFGGLVVAERQASGRDRCRTVVRLYSVEDAGVSAETVGESLRDGQCEWTSFSARWPTSVHLFGQRPGLPKPDLQASGADPGKPLFLAQSRTGASWGCRSTR